MTGFINRVFDKESSATERVMISALCVQAFALPFPILWNTYIMSAVSIITVFIFFLTKSKIQLNIFLIACLAYFVLITVSTLFSTVYEISYKVKPWERNLSFLFFPMLYSMEVVMKLDKEKILRFFTWGCLISSLICVIWAFYRNIYDTRNPADLAYSYFSIYKDHPLSKWIFWDYFLHMELTSILDFHPSYFSLYVAFAGLYLLYTCCAHTTTSNKKFFIIISQFIFLTLFIILLSSRLFIVTYAGLAIGILIFFAYKKKKFKIIYIAVPIASLLFYFSPIANFRVIDQIFNVKNYTLPGNKEAYNPATINGINLRMMSWVSAIRLIQDNWITGVGYYDAKILLKREYSKLGYGDFELNCHNQLLESLLREGILGFFVTVVLLFYPAYAAIKDQSMILLIFAILIITFSFFESIFAVNKGIVFFSFFSSALTIKKPPLYEKV